MKVSIVMGSISDKEIANKVINILKKFGVDYETRVISAHRTPYLAAEFAENADSKGIEVIIAIAGKAAHLAGIIAGITPLPVIGIPAKSSTMDGLDSLFLILLSYVRIISNYLTIFQSLFLPNSPCSAIILRRTKPYYIDYNSKNRALPLYIVL